IEVQDSAYPYHDWNERINAECYAPNTASRIIGGDGAILDIVNNYSKISFNFGPTLLSWMERYAPDAYQAVIEADRQSRERFSGHGSGMAQAYSHMIMPLANSRDKYTQVYWGIKDFQKRFAREPEGMWLPETAVDLETLDIMAQLGIKFTVLAPRQARRVRDIDKADAWENTEDARIDPTMAYACDLPSGRTISLFFYDGPISQGIAFEGLLKSGEGLANRLLGAFSDGRNRDQLVHIATDGETYGHHQRFGDMALAYALHYVEANGLAKVTNYGEYLERHAPTRLVEIYENSSWSCVHGVERWRENCGCNSGMHPGWHQMWRRPLREALDVLRDRCIPLFETEASTYLLDPWQARNDYVDVINDRSPDHVRAYLRAHSNHGLTEQEEERTLKLLGMQRCAMLMYTSCGWFFDEISGLETTQVLQYASRLIQLAGDIDKNAVLEPDFLAALSKAPSNVVENGARVYELHVKPARVDILRVAAHYVISSLFIEYPGKSRNVYSYTVEDEEYDRLVAGPRRLAIGKTHLRANLTWERAKVTFAALVFGDTSVTAGLHHYESDEAFDDMCGKIRAAFEKGDIPETIRIVDQHFPAPYIYSLWHLFLDQQRKVVHEILKPKYEQIQDLYRGVYEGNYGIMDFLRSLGNPLPKSLFYAAGTTLDLGLAHIFDSDFSIDRLQQLVNDARKWSVTLDKDGLALAAVSWIDAQMKELVTKPEDPASILFVEKTKDVLHILSELPLEIHPWRAQNMYFELRKRFHGRMEEKAEKGDDEAKRWVTSFNELGGLFGIKI
ncbi:MAG: DUF3536 domain-containing protein, partial [Syntrophorhabdales bacterium]